MLETRNLGISVNFNRTFRFMLKRQYPLSTVFLPIWFISSLFVLGSCQPREAFPEHAPASLIEFGHGGGFAGIEYNYLLLPDGRLFQKNDETMTFIQKIPKRTTEQLLNNINHLASNMYVLNEPGNTYNYIQWRSYEKKARWVWNSSNQTNLGSLLTINHNILMQLTQVTTK